MDLRPPRCQTGFGETQLRDWRFALQKHNDVQQISASAEFFLNTTQM